MEAIVGAAAFGVLWLIVTVYVITRMVRRFRQAKLFEGLPITPISGIGDEAFPFAVRGRVLEKKTFREPVEGKDAVFYDLRILHRKKRLKRKGGIRRYRWKRVLNRVEGESIHIRDDSGTAKVRMKGAVYELHPHVSYTRLLKRRFKHIKDTAEALPDSVKEAIRGDCYHTHDWWGRGKPRFFSVRRYMIKPGDELTVIGGTTTKTEPGLPVIERKKGILFLTDLGKDEMVKIMRNRAAELRLSGIIMLVIGTLILGGCAVALVVSTL